MKSKIAIFASGNGSNARRLIEYFQGHSAITIDLIVCNRKEAGVLEVANELGIRSVYLPKQFFEDGQAVLKVLKERRIDWIILAGFLLKIPLILIQSYPSKIINIHPALLPKFGGKGMFGDHVHQAVLEAGEEKSGISIHFVDENYDTGSLIAQFECILDKEDDLDRLRTKIRSLEHEYFPIVIERLILENSKA